jgi:hypothetical protein
MVAELREVPKQERWPPDPEIVKQLTDMLEDAKVGKIRAIAFAIVRADDGLEGGTATTGFVRNGASFYALSHAINYLKHRWDTYCDDPRFNA